MTIQKINYGLAPDDGTGDKLRDAFVKTDDNFTDLDTRKANGEDVVDALAFKADVTYVNTELAKKANLASPALTGTPTAPTASAATNTTQLATTAFVQAVKAADTGSAATAVALKTARTINGVSFNGTANITINAVDATSRVASSEKGAANGVASLDATGKVPAVQLPSYVDDVLEFANLAAFPATGESGKIYVALDTNKTYRWSGSAYVYITSGAVDSVAGKTGVVTLVRADVGLSNVDNTADSAKPVSTAQQTALNLKANLASPALTGTPTAPTAATATNTTQLATTAFVQAVNSADTGSSATALTLKTARTINGTSFNGSANITTASWGTARNIAVGSTAKPVDGSVDVSWTVAEIGAEPTLAAGTTAHYYRGDKTWQTLNKVAVGLPNVDNTADSDKPVSTAQQTALNLKANLASPALTGTPTAPTAADGTSSTQLATTAFVQGAVGGFLSKTTTGGTTTLTTAEASNPIIKVSGALTSNAILEIPVASKRNYSIENATTGAFTLTVKHVGLTPSVLVAQGKRNIVMTNGVGAYDAITDFESIALTGTPTAPTAGSTTNNTQVATTAFVQAVNSADTGSSATALTLKTARTINGTSFNGSANITTASWGTARNVTIGSTAKPVDGSVDVSWTVAEVGAEPILAAGSTSQYYRGDKTWQTLNKAAVGLSSVDNTADSAKPVSTAQQTALNLKANLASPALTGTPTAPTAAIATNTTQLATTAFVQAVNSADTGSSATALTLKTARTINGTSFNGSANITTANWGTARNITIGSASKSVDGSVDVSWSFADIGGEPTLLAGTTSQYYRGDKTWQTLNKAAVGLSSVDNTADSAKPVSTAQQTALNLKANLASPALTGTPTAPTAADGTSSTQLATTAFVQGAVGGYLSKSTTGGTITLTTAEASNPVIAISGALTSNAILEIPVATRRIYSISNGTTGAYTLTVKHVGLTPSIGVAQGKRQLVYTNGSGAYDAITDFESIALTGTPTAPTAGSTTNTTQIATTAFVQAVNSADTGSAATAVKLKTARTIGGVSFDGSANINLPGVNSVGNQNTTGSAATLTTARTINGTSFNGSANITTANWGTARNITIGGVAKSVNGSANVVWTADESGAVNSFTSVPTTNQGLNIVVTQPHIRFMVWNGTKYIRAPWHPAGQVGYFLRDIPAGFLEVRADVTLQKANFPDLAEYLGVTGSTFVLDEARGEFIRNLDSGRGKDSGRAVGSHQGDAGRNLTGSMYSTASALREGGQLSVFAEGAFKSSVTATGASGLTGETYVAGAPRGLTLDASLQWPISNEFRVSNRAYRFAVTY